jgi:hypothetical protein
MTLLWTELLETMELENKTASLREIEARIENTCDFNWLDM